MGKVILLSQDKRKKKENSCLGKHGNISPFESITLLKKSIVSYSITEKIQLYLVSLNNVNNLDLFSEQYCVVIKVF